MARPRVLSLIVAVAMAAMLAVAMSSVLSFVVGTPMNSRLRTSRPGVAMEARGGAGGDKIADETYVVGITLFFFVSLAANVQGFFGPW
mmetsp:Transcript_111725/g.316000  ORF Transcript_111725/g.316000 Transcript_111725/m.316000 type:complete len:88 (+) Transcript_111725:98-361(+)